VSDNVNFRLFVTFTSQSDATRRQAKPKENVTIVPRGFFDVCCYHPSLLLHFQRPHLSPRHLPSILLPPPLLLLLPLPIFLPLQPVATLLHLHASTAISSSARERFLDTFSLASAPLSPALRNLRNFFGNARGQATSPLPGLLISQFLQRRTVRCVTHQYFFDC